MRVLLSGAAKEYEIVGLFGFGDTTDFGAVTFAAFDLATAQKEFGAGPTVDAVYVQRDPDVTTAELQSRIESTLGPAYEVLTASEATIQVGKPVRQFLGFFTDALLGFAAIGVVVGAFIIFNTFTILVAQRTRELGLLRAMGATGGQVVRSVVLEAFVVGAVASAIGLGVGVLLGVGLLDLLREIGLDLPATSTVVLGRTVLVSLFVGIVVTVVAAAIPAIRAARVPPGRRDRRHPRTRGRRVRPADRHRAGRPASRAARCSRTGWHGRVTSADSSTRSRWWRSAPSACCSASSCCSRPWCGLPCASSARRCDASGRRERSRVPTPCATRAAPRSPRRRW